MFKLKAFLIFITVLFQLSVHAAEPVIRLYEEDGYEIQIEQVPSYADSIEYLYPRLLNQTKSKIIHSIQNRFAVEIFLRQEEISSPPYQLLLLREQEGKELSLFNELAIYIFEKNKSIGYCIFQRKGINYSENSNKIEEIKKRIPIKDVLSLNLNLPSSASINFYAHEANNFTEVYGIAVIEQEEYLVMDAFFPSSLKTQLKPFMVEQINANLRNPTNYGE